MHYRSMSEVRIKLTPYVDQLTKEIGDLSGRTKTATVEHLLRVVEMLARHGKLSEAFGLEVLEAAAVINARGLGAKHLDPVHLGGGERVGFDERKLERSNKTKTGYAGVSATGTSFRALVPDVEMGSGTRYLPSRPTALLAAIDRYEWFKKHGIPYGNLGWHVEEVRKRNPEWTDRQCLEYLRIVFSGSTFGIKNPVTLDEIEDALAQLKPEPVPVRERVVEVLPTIFEQNEEAMAELAEYIAKEASPPSRLAAVPDVVRCALCKQEIEDGEPFGPHGKHDYAHQACL